MLGSAREGGATESLARRAAEGLPAGARCSWHQLSGLRFPGEGASGAEGDEEACLEATLEHSDLVMVSPLYWYSVSAQTKLYLDHWATWMMRPDLHFRDRMRGKTLWAVSTYARGGVQDAEPLVGMLQRTAGYLDMTWGGALLHRARSNGHLADPDARRHAESFFAAAPESP
ncbi:flavodoxin family protein [Streptomyces sp. NPDC003952]